MRILVHCNHPAHVHFYKNFIRELQEDGHEIGIMATDKDITLDLLDHYEFNYDLTTYPEDATVLRKQLTFTYRTYKMVKRTDPDVLTSIGGTAAAHVSSITRVPSLVFYDTENARLQNAITYPFADRICIPDCYKGETRSNQVRYPGYHELAYLHPTRFSPDPSVLEMVDAERGETLVILRLISWEAMHDLSDSGISDVVGVVEELEETGARVLITAEGQLPAELADHEVSIPPYKMHSLMHYSDLFIGESPTMAAESAVLGTPAVFISTSRRGYTDELEQKYGLVFTFSDERRQREGLQKALSILNDQSTSWEKRRKRVLDEKIDTTSFMISQVHKIVDI